MNKRNPTVQEIEELVSFLPRLYADGFGPIKQWHGGTDGSDGVIIMPWPEYDAAVLELIRVAECEHWTDSNYVPSKAKQMFDDENVIQTANLNEIKTMLTFFVRGERFCNGHWSAMIESGHIQRLLLRLSELVSGTIERGIRSDDDPIDSTARTFTKKSGIYIVRLKNTIPMPVTRDQRYIDSCARVKRGNIKVGKATDLQNRESTYWKEFDQENVLFEPLVTMDDVGKAETVILRALKPYRMLSPKGAMLEWLEGISYEKVKSQIFDTLDANGFEYLPIGP